MGFLRKLFSEDIEDIVGNDDMDILNKISSEIIAEEEAVKEENSVVTNKLPELNDNIEVEIYNGFSSYQFYSYSHKGMVKECNQDSIFSGEINCCSNDKIFHFGIGIVADGMGGLALGETASASAVAAVSTYMHARAAEYIQSGVPRKQIIFDHLSGAIKNANNIVIEKGVELGEQIGTTLTSVLLFGKSAFFGHVGDSRAYIIDIKSKSMEKVSRDHSLVGRLIEMGQLTEKEAKNHPRRNEIYRMLGLRNELEVDTCHRIIDSNSVIVLMSDGLWEFVNDEEIFNEIINSSNLYETAKKFIDMANKNGGSDNISIIIIKPVE